LGGLGGPRVKLPAWLVALTLALFPVAGVAAGPPAYILIDADRSMVLAEHEADVLWYPASLTKLMTAYLTFEALRAGRIKTTSPVAVTANALDQPASKMGFKVGTVMTVDNALKMMMVKSANDIAVAIAETVAGRETSFVALMNGTASRLRMASTHYSNPHGLPDPGQVTTARDLAILAVAVWTDFPEYRDYLGIPAIKSGKTLIPSGNQLLERYHGTTGMKTGFICASGYNLIASATRSDRTMIAVVLGEQSSRGAAEQAASLLNRGFAGREPEAIGLTPVAVNRFDATPIDMREYGVCRPAKGGSGENEADAEAAAGEGAPSALEPRFVLREPVIVTTGGADARPPARPAAIAPYVPLPRLRSEAPALAPGQPIFETTN
jgi:D-alanyl-D-alanine carboxypeptidase